MNHHGRHGALTIALFAALALALPGSAFAAHDLKIYKVEKHLDLDSDDLSFDLSCRTGDIATDGMWRIDHADQDDDELTNTSFLAESVDVPEAYPTDVDTYHFRFLKNSVGRAQVKIFATCLSTPTEPSSAHSHAIQYTTPTATNWNPTLWNSGKVTVSTPPGVGEQAWNTAPTGIAPANYNATLCPANTFVAQPGFKVLPSGSDPAPFSGRLSKSTTTSNMRTWSWTIDLRSDTTAKVEFYALCIRKKVATSGGENHKLVYRYDTDSGSVPAGSAKTLRVSCKASYKAIVAGFEFTFGDLYFLGMDPQPKSRDFRFLNPNGSSRSADLAAICLNYRTT